MKKILLIILIFYSAVSYGQWYNRNSASHIGITKTDSVYKYDNASLIYFAKMSTQLPDSVKQRLDFIIRYFKDTKCSVYGTTDQYSDTTIFQRYDHFYFTCLNDSANSKLDVKGTKNLVNCGNAWVQWKGWQVHAGTNYVTINYNPTIDGINYQLNYAAVQCYVSTMTDITGNQRVFYNLGGSQPITTYQWSGGATTNYINGKYNSALSTIELMQNKMITLSRTHAKLNYFLDNTLIESTLYSASDGLTNSNIVIGYNTDALIGYVGIGGNFTIKDVANINAVIIPFMQWLGN